MKKILLTMALSMVLPSVALAVETATGNCEGGKEVVGKNNGHSYCVSSFGMNWWSAFNWCNSQGRRLATLEEACDRKSIGSTCENLNGVGSGYVWTAIASGDSAAYPVNLSNGAVATGTRTDNGYALCL